MKKEEYDVTQAQVMTIAMMIDGLTNLDEFLHAIAISHAAAPFIDPTMYRDALHSGNLQLIESVAGILRRTRVDVRRAIMSHPKGADLLKIKDAQREAEKVVSIERQRIEKVSL